MSDSDNPYAASNASDKRPAMSRAAMVLISVVIIMTLLNVHLFLSSSVPSHRYSHTCAICRQRKAHYHSDWTGTSITNHESVCSTWYEKNIEPTHEHVWVRSSTTGILNGYGQKVGVGDNDSIPGRVIWRLSSEDQISIYKNFPDPMEAKALFVSLTEPEMLVDKRDYLILRSLKDWMNSGFEGEWVEP